MAAAQTAHLQAPQAYPRAKLAKEPFFAHAPTEITIFNFNFDNR
jgi:hypothetical protein